MPVHVSPDVILTRPQAGFPAHCIIADRASEMVGNRVATSTEPGGDYSAEAPSNPLTADRWKPERLPAEWSIHRLGRRQIVDYCAIAAHNMGDLDCWVRVLAESDDITENFIRHSEKLDASNWTRAEHATIYPASAISVLAWHYIDEAPSAGTQQTVNLLDREATDFFLSILVEEGTGTHIALAIDDASGAENFGAMEINLADLSSAKSYPTASDGAALSHEILPHAGPQGGRLIKLSLSVSAPTPQSSIRVTISPNGYRRTGSCVVHFTSLELQSYSRGYVRTGPKIASETKREIVSFTPVTDNSALFFVFAEITTIRMTLEIFGETAPEIGFIRFGKRFAIEGFLRYDGHRPLLLNRRVTMRSNTSVRGQYLGRTVQASEIRGDLQFSHISEAFGRGRLTEFLRGTETDTFIVAPRPDLHPEDCALMWTEGTTTPSPYNEGLENCMSLDLSLTGYPGDE